MQILIRNGHVLDPDTGRDGEYDILVEDGKILKVEERTSKKASEAWEECMGAAGAEARDGSVAEAGQVIDAAGLYVLPGFIDLHVHFRDPGQEYKETVATGTAAAARGGYTAVCTMPNTFPVMDTAEHLQIQLDRIREQATIHVLPVGAVTMGQEGREIAELEAMKELGMVAISEDGKSVMDAKLYRQAMLRAAAAGLPVFAHCEDRSLVGRGALNAGPVAESLGVAGISNAVEDVITARDILLAKETGVRLHLCHCSTQDSVRLVKFAKDQDLPVTAEVCPHHFTLTEEDIPGDDANFKMNPPLRSQADVDALRLGLKENIMDVIATDHAPHSAEEKAQPIASAPFGIVGLETAFSLAVTELVEKGYLTRFQLVEKMSRNPARVLGIPKGTLREGAAADLVLVDFDAQYEIDPAEFASKGKNTPFAGKKVSGRVELTMVDGQVVYERTRE